MTTPPQQPGSGDAEDKQPEQPEEAAAGKPDGESATTSQETGQDSHQDEQEPAESERPTPEADDSEVSSESSERGADDSVSATADPESEHPSESTQASESDRGSAEPASAEQDAVGTGSSDEVADSEQASDAADEGSAGSEGEAGTPANDAGESEAEQSEARGKKSKRKVALIAGIAAAVVVVLGGAGGAYAYYQSNTAEAAAEEYVELTSKEVQNPRSVTADDYRAVVCKKAMPQIEQVQKQKEKFLEVAKPQQLEQIKKSNTELKGVQRNGDTATAEIATSMPGQQPQVTKLDVIQEDGSWKLCA